MHYSIEDGAHHAEDSQMLYLKSAFSFIDKPFTEQETFSMPCADTPLDTCDDKHLAYIIVK